MALDIDSIARGLAGGMSRRDALRASGAAFLGAVTYSPVDAVAATTRRCPPHRVKCSGVCCPKGEVCLAPKRKGGKHRCGCPAHTTRCGSACVNLQTNVHNCGHCGHGCAQGQHCTKGHCVTPVTEPTCPAGQAMCGGVCVDQMTDAANCGANCSNCTTLPFVSRAHCANGVCVIDQCAPNWVDCDGNPLTGCETLGTTCPA
jgi:hypothetical protein